MFVLDGLLGKIFQDNCFNFYVILVDERFLIGFIIFGWMEFYSRCGIGIFDKLWGGILVVVFFGDDV